MPRLLRKISKNKWSEIKMAYLQNLFDTKAGKIMHWILDMRDFLTFVVLRSTEMVVVATEVMMMVLVISVVNYVYHFAATCHYYSNPLRCELWIKYKCLFVG